MKHMISNNKIKKDKVIWESGNVVPDHQISGYPGPDLRVTGSPNLDCSHIIKGEIDEADWKS
jgi:hypothetical protein